LFKNGHPLRFPCLRAGPSSLQRTSKYALAGSPTRPRGKKSLLIRRDATLKISGALHLTFLNNLTERTFSATLEFGI